MFLKIRRLFVVVATLAVVTAVSSCAESSRPQATGKGNVRGINAIVTAPDISFLIEERSISSFGFRGTSGFNRYDDLSYNFNFDLLRPGIENPDRLTTQFIDVLADHEYTVVLTGSIANPSSLFWEDPIRVWSGTETVFEVFFAHLAPSMGDLDVYFAAPGTVPVLGQAVGSLTHGDRLPGMEFEAVQYQLILTPKDDPTTIVYQSVPLATAAQARVMIAVFDPDPSVPGNVSVSFFDQAGASASLGDVNFPPQVRTLHAAFGTESFDGYFDSDFTSVIYSDIAFREISPYADVFDVSTLLTLTPVGNSGATIHEGEAVVPTGGRRTVALIGEPGALAFVTMQDDAKPLETFPVMRILNASVNTEAVNVYILEPGTPIDDTALPTIIGIPTGTNTGFAATRSGMRELTITLVGSQTPIAAPLILDLADGDIVDIFIADTVDPTVLEWAIIDAP
jgi:hypothetical protein